MITFIMKTITFKCNCLLLLVYAMAVCCRGNISLSQYVNIMYMLTGSFFSANVGSIYSEYKDEDGFLYVCYSGESTFGQ